MNENLNKQIREHLNLKTTDELLDLWQANDRVEWSDAAFEVMQEILTERGEEIPEQDEPIHEHVEEVDTVKEFGFTEGEMKIIEAETQPELYDPLDVLLIKKRIEQAAAASIVLIAISTLLNFPDSKNMAAYLLQSFPPLTSLVFPIAVTATLIAIGLAVITTYLPLKALARILQILMEMEFNSRIDK
jgi:hypothetical protein